MTEKPNPNTDEKELSGQPNPDEREISRRRFLYLAGGAGAALVGAKLGKAGLSEIGHLTEEAGKVAGKGMSKGNDIMVKEEIVPEIDNADKIPPVQAPPVAEVAPVHETKPSHEKLPEDLNYYKLRQNQSEIINNLNLEPDKKAFLGNVVVAAEILGAENPDINLGVMVAQAMIETGWGRSQMMHQVDGRWVPTGNILGIKGGDGYSGHQLPFNTPERNPQTGEYYTINAPFRVYDKFGVDPPDAEVKKCEILQLVACMRDYVAHVIDSNPSFADARAVRTDAHQYAAHLEDQDQWFKDKNGHRYEEQQYATAGQQYVSDIDSIVQHSRLLELIDRNSRKP